MLKYTMVVTSVTTIGVKEKGLVQFMRAIFSRTNESEDMEAISNGEQVLDNEIRRPQSVHHKEIEVHKKNTHEQF